LEGRDGHEALFGSITVPNRAYRVEAVALMGASSTLIGLPLVLEANQSYRFMIEHWPPGQTAPKTQQVRIRFWPPVAERDDVDSWTCLCGRPLSQDPHGAGHHWELRIPVRYEGYEVLGSVR
jgi:hypothetical protein